MTTLPSDDAIPGASITTATYADDVETAGDVVAVIDAAQNVDETISKLQTQVDALTAASKTQEHETARLHAAINCLPCPTGTRIVDDEAPNGKRASIGECTEYTVCGCELGYILSSATWAPVTSEGETPANEAAPS